MNYFRCIFLLLLFLQCKPKEDNNTFSFPGKPEVPESILLQHHSLLDQIKSFTAFQDSTGRVASRLEEVMVHHFEEEERYVLPPLGLLPLLSGGEMPAESDKIILLTDEFKAQFDHMSAEHQFIVALAEELTKAAETNNHPGISQFVKELKAHASAEEEIYFPAALLVGDFLKLKVKQTNSQ